MEEKNTDKIASIREKIERNNESKRKIQIMRQQIEEYHNNKIKRLNVYMNSGSLSNVERMMYSDKIHMANKAFINLDDEYENALRRIDRENDENEEQIRYLERQEDDEDNHSEDD